MGFTPFKAFIKGGADYNNKVNLMRLQGEQDLRKVRATATAKALADSSGSIRSFTAGNIKLTFNDSQAKDASTRTNDNIGNLYEVLGTDKYKAFADAAKAQGPKGLAKLQQLNNFAKGRHLNWLKINEFTEGDAKTAKVVKYTDITKIYPQALEKGYGESYLTDVVAESYGKGYETWQKKYGSKLGMLSKKVLQPEGFVAYQHIPYFTKSFYDSKEGQKIVKDATYVASQFGEKYTDTLSRWQVGNDSNKQIRIWEEFGKLKNSLPAGGIKALDDSEPFLNTIAVARKNLLELGVSRATFSNMLESLSPNLASSEPADQFIYTDQAGRQKITDKQNKEHLLSTYQIDQENAGNKAGGARRAGGIARSMINTLSVGFGKQQTFVAKFKQFTNGVFGDGGVIKGFANYGAWLSGDNNFNQSATGRARLKGTLDGYRERMKSGNADTAATARVNFLKFNLAYEMASAFQGGTGGRTISDQDIENMMAAMNFTATSNESDVLASLSTIASIMDDVAVIQDGYSKGGRKAAASYILEKANAALGLQFNGNADFVGYATGRLSGKKAEYDLSKGMDTIVNPNFGKPLSGRIPGANGLDKQEFIDVPKQ